MCYDYFYSIIIKFSITTVHLDSHHSYPLALGLKILCIYLKLDNKKIYRKVLVDPDAVENFKKNQ